MLCQPWPRSSSNDLPVMRIRRRLTQVHSPFPLVSKTPLKSSFSIALLRPSKYSCRSSMRLIWSFNEDPPLGFISANSTAIPSSNFLVVTVRLSILPSSESKSTRFLNTVRILGRSHFTVAIRRRNIAAIASRTPSTVPISSSSSNVMCQKIHVNRRGTPIISRWPVHGTGHGLI